MERKGVFGDKCILTAKLHQGGHIIEEVVIDYGIGALNVNAYGKRKLAGVKDVIHG
jgi:hypothetical protein